MARKWHKLKRNSVVFRIQWELEGQSWLSYNFCSRERPLFDLQQHGRFMLPLTYLRHEIFQKLLKISEEEFGLPICGPIILPCDSVFMDSLVSLIQRSEMARNLEKAQLNGINIVSSCLQFASTAFRHGYFDHHLVTCCYY
ncbi:LOW QUALITY PROTEIN: Small auxin-up RNA [Parasponia andersonii]|uniref:Small auxin-up RNA n=1 Tax=Parasponia andersonii TaxID=3476 RepID=A0A2P5AIK1_PARAD|nr:LOW QUALITY PROTEIN: Small auxin-up RNA [Parasponia andersonii]